MDNVMPIGGNRESLQIDFFFALSENGDVVNLQSQETLGSVIQSLEELLDGLRDVRAGKSNECETMIGPVTLGGILSGEPVRVSW